jgi:putative redox protein
VLEAISSGMVEISIAYEGGFHCFAIHEPSRAKLLTDAPKDNFGKGEAFSPTDLTATSLGVCMLTHDGDRGGEALSRS